MSSYKQFLDAVFYSIKINEVVERRKCRATGKVRFNAESEANFFIQWLKWSIRKWLEKPVRRKHRNTGMGSKGATPRYVYYCEFCAGYHITKKNPYDYQFKREKYHRSYFG